MISAVLEWDRNPAAFLKGVRGSLKNKCIRIAMNKAAAPVKADVVAKAPKRSGALKSSFRIKVKNYKNSNIWVALIGPKSNYVRKRKGKVVQPAHYWFILNDGSKYIVPLRIVQKAQRSSGGKFAQVFSDELRRQIIALFATGK